MTVQNAGLLAALIGVLLLLLTPYQALGLVTLIAGCVVAIIGIIIHR